MIEPKYTTKDIEGYEGKYCITSCGKVWSYDNNIFLSVTLVGKNKYQQVKLYKDGIPKAKLVHRLVAEAYIENPYNLPKVDHIKHNGTWHPEYKKNLQWSDEVINGCNKKGNLPVLDIITGEEYCSISRAVRATGVKRYWIKKDCEDYKNKGEARRFVYDFPLIPLKDYDRFQWDILMKKRDLLDDKQGA